MLCAVILQVYSQTNQKSINNQEVASSNDVVKLLTEMGYENVRFLETEKEIIYTIENNYEKRMGVGLARALSIISKNGLNTSSDGVTSNKNQVKPCRVIVTEFNIPKISMTLSAENRIFLENTMKLNTGSGEIACDLSGWKVSYDIGEDWKTIRKAKKHNSSLFKVDINIYPQLSYKNLIITQIYQVLFKLSPSVDVSLWPGSKLSFMMKMPVYNDGYGKKEDKTYPGHITLSQRFRLPYNIWGRATVGAFNNLSWGGDLQLVYPFKFNERFSLSGRLGYTGIQLWNGFKWHYDNNMMTTWSFGGNYYWVEQNMQLSLAAEKYIVGDKGIKAEAIRHFRYASVGFYAVKGFDKEAHLNAGFRIQILLPFYKQKRMKRYKYVPRVNFSPNMGIKYNANNEFVYYREYKAEASDNIMSNNKLNPFFVKSEINKY